MTFFKEGTQNVPILVELIKEAESGREMIQQINQPHAIKGFIDNYSQKAYKKPI